MEIFKLGKLYKTIVINRPSKKIRSPYLADIIDPLTNSTVLAHSPSLGLCGIIKEDTIVKVIEKNNTAKSKYSIDFVIIKEKNKLITIGVNPIYANHMIKFMLANNLIVKLQNLNSIKNEYNINDCRLDFFCTKNNKNIYIEVKNVPLAEYYDSKHVNKDIIYNSNNKIAVFPDGYRKNCNEAISERALKHIKTLIKLTKDNNETYMIYIVQRNDVDALTISILDAKYYKEIIKAKEKGVTLLAYKIIWKGSKAYFGGEIPILL